MPYLGHQTQRQAGFTLIELMIVISLVAVLATLAFPNFRTFRQNAEMRTVANEFLSAVNLAKSEAMRTNTNTIMRPNLNGDWRTGWTIFIDADFNGSLTNGTDTVVVSSGSLPEGVRITNAAQAAFQDAAGNRYISFSSNGFPRLATGSFAADRIVFTNDSASRSVLMAPSGRVRVCVTGSNDCR